MNDEARMLWRLTARSASGSGLWALIAWFVAGTVW